MKLSISIDQHEKLKNAINQQKAVSTKVDSLGVVKTFSFSHTLKFNDWKERLDQKVKMVVEQILELKESVILEDQRVILEGEESVTSVDGYRT